METKTNKKKTFTGVAIALALLGVVGGGVALNSNGEGKAEVVKVEGVSTVEETPKYTYNTDDSDSILYIEEELAKLDREETEKRQVEFEVRLAEQKKEENRLAEEARVKAEQTELEEVEGQTEQVQEEQTPQTQTVQAQGGGQSTQVNQTTTTSQSGGGTQSGSSSVNKGSSGGQATAPKQQAPQVKPQPAPQPVAPKPAPQPSTKPQESKVSTQQTESDQGYPVEGDGLGGKNGNRGDGEKGTIDWKEDELLCEE